MVHKWCKSISVRKVYHKTEDDIYIELPVFGTNNKFDMIDIAVIPPFKPK